MRIRSIKPEFWRSDDIAALPLSARLLFIGLWSYVDDNGVGSDKLSSIAADLFAEDLSVDPTETLRRVAADSTRLFEAGLIVRYEAEGKALLYVTNWESHQIVKNPSKGHCYPLPPGDLLTSAKTLRRPSVDPPETLGTGAGEQGNRGTGINTAHHEDAPRASKADLDAMFDRFWSAYPVRKGKEPARKAFEKAIKAGASLDEILAGVESYKRELGPVTGGKTLDGRTPKWAQGWLNDKRWMDEPDGPSLDQAWASALSSVDPCASGHRWTVDGTCANCIARRDG